MTKHIIFDLGGVLINLDYNKTTAAFKELGIENFENLFSQFKADELFTKLETGKVSEEHFYQVMSVVCRRGTNQEQIRDAWDAMLLDFREKSLEFLIPLAQKYPLYLLSNTNSIHHTAFNRTLLKQTGKTTLDGYFIKSYYSHLIGKRKPSPETYRFVLEDAGISAGETLFIDDSINNIEAAAALGLKTHQLKAGETIETLDYNYLTSSKSM
jgi:HAD superfamily hydrolase (TIGR01509 family)